jgi:hypothetical protein
MTPCAVWQQKSWDESRLGVVTTRSGEPDGDGKIVVLNLMLMPLPLPITYVFPRCKTCGFCGESALQSPRQLCSACRFVLNLFLWTRAYCGAYFWEPAPGFSFARIVDPSRTNHPGQTKTVAVVSVSRPVGKLASNRLSATSFLSYPQHLSASKAPNALR